MRDSTASPAVLGIENLMANHLDLLKGRRVGLITHPAAIDRNFRSTAEILLQHPQIRLTTLYGPEHGIRGNAQAGECVPYYFDEKLKLPVYSLYGQNFSLSLAVDLDAAMRSFDTTNEGKKIEDSMFANIDVMLCDLQDVGTRIYTYVATMAYAMQACAKHQVDFIVLDRPNPINGVDTEGPLLDYPQYSSFVGLYPIPVRHGMTMGELAKFFNEHFLSPKANLTVIPMLSWHRSQWFDQTGLRWIPPSPNMPSINTAIVYPGQVFFEGTNMSEGRGTTLPFETVGAGWLDGYNLARAMNALALPGVYFREAWFRPVFSKFADQLCGGVQLHIIDRQSYQPFATALHLLRQARLMAPNKFHFHSDYFDKIIGSSRVRMALTDEKPVAEILAGCHRELATFALSRQPSLLYDMI
jgi:uncharacterized protein YbbC (DUF1343 family)